MAHVVRLQPRASEAFTRSLGMFIALGAWAMMFAALFYTYFGVRARSSMWPPVGVPQLPVALPAFNTVVLLGSSALIMLGIRRLEAGQRTAFAVLLGLAVVLGASFLGLQVWMWNDLYFQGLLPSTGVYGSVFYGLTGLHAAHVAAGLLVLLVVLVRTLRGTYDEHNAYRVRIAMMFWHFVDVVWVLMFFTIYLA